MLISRPLRTFGKQPGPTGVTTTMILWLLPAKYSTHDIWNAKQIANKTNPYRKIRPGNSLTPDTCKRDNRVNMHCNIWKASLSLPEVNLWYHTRTSRRYDCYWSGNRPRQPSTPGWILGHRWSKNCHTDPYVYMRRLRRLRSHQSILQRQTP